MWIGEVFARERAELIGLEDIAHLFHRPPEMATLESPGNHLVLGSKGCGKSTALRALAYTAWKSRDSLTKPAFLGVYVPMAYEEIALFLNRFNELQETALFE